MTRILQGYYSQKISPDTWAMINLYYGKGMITTNLLGKKLLLMLNKHIDPSSIIKKTISSGNYISQQSIKNFEQDLIDHKIFSGKSSKKIELKPDIPTMKFWISLTNDCNFRCVYCFVSKTPQMMSLKKLESVLPKLYADSVKLGYKKMEFILAGGEPLLNMPLIKIFQKNTTKLSSDFGIPSETCVITNGSLLTDDLCLFLKKNNVTVSISIDGIGKYHDMNRPFQKKVATYNYVLRGIQMAKKHNLLSTLLVTVTSLNVDHVPEFVEYNLKHFHVPIYFGFYKGNNFSDKSLKPTDRKLIKAMKTSLDMVFEDYAAKGKVTSPIAENMVNIDYVLTNYPYKAIQSICGAGMNYLTITHNGGIKYCPQQEYPAHLLNTQEKTNAISIANSSALKYYQGLSVDHVDACKNCIWNKTCVGGCRNERKTINSNMSQPSAYCNVYKKLFAYHIELEAKRILRVSSHLPHADKHLS